MNETLYEPEKNNLEYLKERVEELRNLPDEKLKELAQKGEEEIKEANEKELTKIYAKHKINGNE